MHHSQISFIINNVYSLITSYRGISVGIPSGMRVSKSLNEKMRVKIKNKMYLGKEKGSFIYSGGLLQWLLVNWIWLIWSAPKFIIEMSLSHVLPPCHSVISAQLETSKWTWGSTERVRTMGGQAERSWLIWVEKWHALIFGLIQLEGLISILGLV